jgi:hypothetical protein
MIGRYCKDHLGAILFYVFTIATFWLVAGLYAQYRSEIFYATCITLAVGIVLGIVDFLRYRQRMSYLEQLNAHGAGHHLNDGLSLCRHKRND